ncbi:uncharacterized protein LOC129724330 [Wyeomyia smithii]|uniref:uncharacterized protein LOC129724330 n=1 Tax=Wyeomyia smithii TaxID=174621 RepID=UPI002467AD85|nr:uncharacterized protein LOC129724330 [Wyeomyia smithii]
MADEEDEFLIDTLGSALEKSIQTAQLPEPESSNDASNESTTVANMTSEETEQLEPAPQPATCTKEIVQIETNAQPAPQSATCTEETAQDLINPRPADRRKNRRKRLKNHIPQLDRVLVGKRRKTNRLAALTNTRVKPYAFRLPVCNHKAPDFVGHRTTTSGKLNPNGFFRVTSWNKGMDNQTLLLRKFNWKTGQFQDQDPLLKLGSNLPQ